MYNVTMRRLFYTFLTAVVLAACTPEPEVDWAVVPGSSNYALEYGKGAIPRQKRLKLRESEQAELRAYLQEFVKEADVSLVTYAPGFIFAGEGYTLNFNSSAGVVVLGIRRPGDTSGNVQLVRESTEADAAMLEMLRKRVSQRSLKR